MRFEQLDQTSGVEMDEIIRSYEFEQFLEIIQDLPHGKPETYGATPLDRMATLQQQLDLALDLQELTYRHIPDDVPIEMIDYVHSVFIARFHKRAEANEENYMTALRSKEEFQAYPEVMATFERGELGYASPSELLVIRNILGIRSVELACVTHPYGKRMEYLSDMREAVKQHVELLEGTYFDDPEPRYRVKDIIGYEKGQEKFDKGVLMTRKRTLGVMPDGTLIRERSSFVLRLDEESPFTPEAITALEQVDLSRNDWQDELVRAGHLDEVAAILLAMDEPGYSFAIPVSSTIYAFNRETAQAVAAHQETLSKQRLAVYERNWPEVFGVMQGGSNSSRVFEDRDGIFFVGPAEDANSDEPSDEALDV